MPSAAIQELIEILTELDIKPVLDMKASIRGDCNECGTPAPPREQGNHDLLVVGTHTRSDHPPLRRPYCPACRTVVKALGQRPPDDVPAPG